MNAAWRRVFEILRKEFRQVLREPRMLGMLIGPPVLQLLIFGYAVNMDVDHSWIAWMDQDRTPQSRELLARFEGSPQFRVAAARGGDHGRCKIDAHALGRLQCREQVAASAAKFQHAQPGRHQEAIDGLEPSMIACSRTPRACRPAGDSLPVGNACAAVGRRRGIPGLSRRRGHGPFLWGPQRSHHVRVRIWILSGHAWSPASALVLCPWTVLQPPAL